MQTLLTVVLPVFLVIGFGYVAVRLSFFKDSAVDGLMVFTQNFAIPCLLFSAIASLDLSASFDTALLGSFYAGAGGCFLLGLFGARYLFGRDWEDSVAIGFCCLFSNSLMLGLAMTEQAYGPDALEANYAIIAVHSPFCYGLGITAMEIARARGRRPAAMAGNVLRAMFKNALILGIALGFIVNLGGVAVPEVISDAVDMMARAALPAALFGLGGVLVRYRPEGDMTTIVYVCAISLLLHPLIVWTLGSLGELGRDAFRSAVLTAAMAPGANAYVFANMYGRARRVAASSVLIGTVASVLTAWMWLNLLP